MTVSVKIELHQKGAGQFECGGYRACSEDRSRQPGCVQQRADQKVEGPAGRVHSVVPPAAKDV